MILSDSGIFDALDDGRLRISPEPGPRYPTMDAPATPYNRTAVNLTLGPTLRLPRSGVGVVIDPMRGSAPTTLRTLYDPRDIPAEGFVLDPQKFILGVTRQVITLPLPPDLDPAVRLKGCLAARVEGKSSLARFGLLVHFTAPTIHAGFAGAITLEMMNLGPAPIRLSIDIPICQLILEEVAGEPLSGGGQFHGQMDAAGPAAGH